MKTGNIAVIDVGSNTIKLLVATAGPNDTLVEIDQISDPTRIGSGIGDEIPSLSPASMEAGITSIQRLLAKAATKSPSDIQIVATGAVRDARNGDDFAQLVLSTTGHPLSILSGTKEASYIAAGILTDPDLNGHTDFLACDLGGGSLELIWVESRQTKGKTSLPLGAVRLTERFVTDPREPISASETIAMTKYVQDTLTEAKFPFPETPPSVIATGGAFVTARTVLAEEEGINFADRSFLHANELTKLLTECAALPIAERLARFPGLTSTRADVMPAALACIIALLQHVGVEVVRNSLRNLRYGIASELLGKSI